MKIDWKNRVPAFFLFLLIFALPFEHKYDKLFRYYSLTLIPENLGNIQFFEKKIYFYGSDLLAVMLFAIGAWRIGRKFFGGEGSFLWVVFFAAVCSILGSSFAGYPVAYTRLWQLFTPIAVYLFLAKGSLGQEKATRIVVWAIFSAAVVESCIAIAQYFLQRPLGLRMLNETSLLPGFTMVASGKTSLLDFSQSLQTASQIYRAVGTMTHPNMLGGFCVLALLTTSYLFLKQPKIRIWLGLAYAVELFALATTYSRAAIYAWALGTCIYLGWIYGKEKLAALTILIVSSFIFVGAVFHEQYLHRGGIVTYNQATKGSDAVRLSYQKIALVMMRAHPWLGVGYGQFSCKSVPFYPEKADPSLAASGVHNIYLRLGAETGLISLMAFLTWIVVLLRAGWRAAVTLETGFLMAVFIAFLFIGCCDQYFIVFQQGALMFFAVAGLLACHGHFGKVVYDR